MLLLLLPPPLGCWPPADVRRSVGGIYPRAAATRTSDRVLLLLLGTVWPGVRVYILCRQVGQLAFTRSHSSTQPLWNRCLHGRRRACSPTAYMQSSSEKGKAANLNVNKTTMSLMQMGQVLFPISRSVSLLIVTRFKASMAASLAPLAAWRS